ncbi:hypothetical protein [Acinetobacter shaoyimingii]|uniref:Uncharacterized protein n=1 Tax=Acinetobacter shaoyimingii TaxID=2715164 RepID=A0A6G8RYB8_9GAMM|nr:hypothetical protein [Acinetobacter shaoyimingii]QIO06929.1 hypothetical protein G8E00_13735 [Acinetobacter shaoyimingii]
MLGILLFFLLVMLLIYFPVKIVAEKFGAERTNFLSIICAIILNGVIQAFLIKKLQNEMVVFIVMIFISALVYQFILSIENFKKSLLVSIVSQVIILILLCILLVIGIGFAKV